MSRSQVPTHLIPIKACGPPYKKGRLLCYQNNIYINIFISVHHHFLSNQASIVCTIYAFVIIVAIFHCLYFVSYSEIFSVNHHFLSNQIHTSFHSLYYVPFYDNNCNIPLSVFMYPTVKYFPC